MQQQLLQQQQQQQLLQQQQQQLAASNLLAIANDPHAGLTAANGSAANAGNSSALALAPSGAAEQPRKKLAAAPAVQTAGGKKSGAKEKCVKKDGNNLKPRRVDVEMNRKHVLARTGLTTYPRSKSFPFKSVIGMDAAKRKAEAWLKEMKV